MNPNILIIIPHDLGDTLHCYGHRDVRSPNLDAMAERGVRFSHYFCASPECSPSRGAMMTGFHPHRNGMMGLSNFGWQLREPHLARRLADAGYTTHLFGLQHETDESPEILGYQQVHLRQGTPPGEQRRVQAVCDDVCEFLQGGDPQDCRPWFACAGFFDVHRKWPDTVSFTASEVHVPPFLPDNPTVREDLSKFYQNIQDMDAAVGRVLEVLAASSAANDTLVIFTTDHGAGFPRAKATLYDPGLRIPLIMHWPVHIEGGHVHEQLLGNVDLTPTLLELAGADEETAFHGRSFAPLLRNGAYVPADQVTASLFYDVAYDPMHAVRTPTHKYIRSFAVAPEDAAGANPESLATHIAGQWIRVDDYDVMSSPTWGAMAAAQPKPPREELYDLRTDPWEQNNLAEDPAARDILNDMRQRLHAWMVETESPLLHGHIQPPEKQLEATRRYRPGGPMYAREES